ncbi:MULTISPECIES: hypothetical protein [Sphingomonas]|jgi:DNA-binding MarR family transcriptional regulator|uniref:hypothetical protein n=1 Tax=Sphingomonas TaxID=13687 RepID=UPI001AE9F5E1
MSDDSNATQSDLHTALAALAHEVKTLRARIETVNPTSIAHWANQHYQLRRHRNTIFSDEGDLFREPAWDILLDLAAATAQGREISVSSACVAAHVAPTTALRYISHLETRGLVYRVEDPSDRRRNFLHLGEGVMEKLVRVQGSEPQNRLRLAPIDCTDIKSMSEPLRHAAMP